MMLIPAPSSSRIISGILLSAAVLRHSVLAGSGAVYGKGIISSAFVEFNGEVIRRGSEAFFEITTGDDAEVPDVTCESPWMRLRAFNGRMDGTGKQIRPIEYKFIPRPGDNASLEKFTLCLAEATGLPRSFEAEFNEDGIRLRVGRAIRKGNRKERFTPWFGEIPLSGHYRIAVDEQATETGGDNGSLRGPSSACEGCVIS